jgi:hypothetical protein
MLIFDEGGKPKYRRKTFNLLTVPEPGIEPKTSTHYTNPHSLSGINHRISPRPKGDYGGGYEGRAICYLYKPSSDLFYGVYNCKKDSLLLN